MHYCLNLNQEFRWHQGCHYNCGADRRIVGKGFRTDPTESGVACHVGQKGGGLHHIPHGGAGCFGDGLNPRHYLPGLSFAIAGPHQVTLVVLGYLPGDKQQLANLNAGVESWTG